MDFAVWLGNSVLYLPKGQVKFFGNSTEILPTRFPKLYILRNGVTLNQSDISSNVTLYEVYANCGRPEEPAIQISRLLLRMSGRYVAGIRIDFTTNEWQSYA